MTTVTVEGADPCGGISVASKSGVCQSTTFKVHMREVVQEENVVVVRHAWCGGCGRKVELPIVTDLTK